MHIPALGGGMTTSSRMLSPCWTTCVSAHRTAVLEISLAAARTATTTTAPAPAPFSAAALFLILERQELLPAGSEHLPVRKRETKQSTPDAEEEAMAPHSRAPTALPWRLLMPGEGDEERVLQKQPPLGAASVRGEKKNKQEAINRGEKEGGGGGPTDGDAAGGKHQAAQGGGRRGEAGAVAERQRRGGNGGRPHPGPVIPQL